MKEAVYKALNRGEPFVPRHVEVLPDGQFGYDVRYAGAPLDRRATFRCWRIGDQTAVMVLIPSEVKRCFSTGRQIPLSTELALQAGRGASMPAHTTE
jgi:hypothetical protein